MRNKSRQKKKARQTPLASIAVKNQPMVSRGYNPNPHRRYLNLSEEERHRFALARLCQ
jgi:hypothetical protein